jgi:hypothetical protein
MAFKPVKVPDSGVINNPEGVNDILGFYNDLTRAINGLSKQAGSGDFVSLYYRFPDNGSIEFINIPSARKVRSVTTKSVSGSCTVEFSVNGTPLSGGPNSASTTQQVVTHDDEIPAGADWSMGVSANANCEGLSVTLWIENA